MNNKIYNKTALILITLLGLMVLFIFAYSSCETETYADSTYNIYYVLDGGTNSPSNPTSVSSSSSSITLQPATKSGYKFLGWYKDSSYSKYIEKIKPSTMSGDMTLYALFTPYISLPVKYLYTDYYSAIDDVKGYINCYYSYSAYYYENVTSVASMVSGHSSYTIYSTSNTALSLGLDEGEYYSSASAGTPSYIRIASDTFYSINYELNGGAFKSGDLAYNYYYTRANITSHELTPIKDDAVFMGWYLDSSFTTTYYSSSFTPSNITLYAKWSAIHTINALYITTDFFAINEEVVRTIEYYDDDSDYIYSSNFAELFNLHTDYQFTIYNTSGNAISYFINEGVYASSKAYGTPSYIRYNTPQIYTIQYVLGDGGSVQEGKPLYSYYTKRADLTGNTNTPIKEGFRFLEWYLDSEYTQTMYSSSFTPSNITLYAKWGEISSVEAKITTTDFYIKTTQTILSVEYFDDTYDYIYDDSFANLFNYYTEYSFNIYTADNNIIPYYFNEGVYASSKANGVPAYIKYEAPEIYTISYVIGEDAIIPDGRQLYNYYTKRADLKDNTVEPIKENCIFSGWYLDAEHTSTIYSSSFTPSNITLYADWAELLYAPVMFYDALGDMELVNLGATYYYLSLDNDYVLGDYSDNTRQLPYYFDITGSDSYKVFSKSGNELSVYISEGYLLTKADEEIDYIKIYKHFTAQFYVNGEYVFESRGSDNETIAFPDFIVGFIGQNYNAITIGPIILGKEYAVYIMKGWSLTDSSDITWLDETEVPLVEDTATFVSLADGEHNIKLYAYMTFYGKVNAINSEIDYDQYIATTKGLITKASPYSLDDLMLEHVTEISSGAQKSNLDKILKYFKLDNLGNNTLSLLSKLFNGDHISFSDLWNSILGKIIIIILGISTLAIAIMNIINLVKALTKIQTNS